MNKLCECGCGGEVKNQSARWIKCHHNRSPEFIEKSKLACIRKYGVSNVSKVKEIKDKKLQTCLQNYGVKNPSQSKEIKEKIKETCLERYDNEHWFQNSDIKEKIEKTMLERYGVEHALQSEEIKEKMEKTMLDRHGVENPSQSKEIKLKKRQTCMDHYGVDNWAKTDEGRRANRSNCLKRIEDQLKHGEPVMPTVGKKERPFLNELQKYSNFKIIRQDHFFRKIIVRFPDGHIPELKLIILFDECAHFVDTECTTLNEASLLESSDYESLDGYSLFRVSEKDWINNKEEVIERFKSYLTICICIPSSCTSAEKFRSPPTNPTYCGV